MLGSLLAMRNTLRREAIAISSPKHERLLSPSIRFTRIDFEQHFSCPLERPDSTFKTPFLKYWQDLVDQLEKAHITRPFLRATCATFVARSFHYNHDQFFFVAEIGRNLPIQICFTHRKVTNWTGSAVRNGFKWHRILDFCDDFRVRLFPSIEVAGQQR